MSWIKYILSIISSISAYFQQKQLINSGKAIEKSRNQEKELNAISKAKQIEDDVDAMSDNDKRDELRKRIQR